MDKEKLYQEYKDYMGRIANEDEVMKGLAIYRDFKAWKEENLTLDLEAEFDNRLYKEAFEEEKS